eukprot:gene408-740_t
MSTEIIQFNTPTTKPKSVSKTIRKSSSDEKYMRSPPSLKSASSEAKSANQDSSCEIDTSTIYHENSFEMRSYTIYEDNELNAPKDYEFDENGISIQNYPIDPTSETDFHIYKTMFDESDTETDAEDSRLKNLRKLDAFAIQSSMVRPNLDPRCRASSQRRFTSSTLYTEKSIVAANIGSTVVDRQSTSMLPSSSSSSTTSGGRPLSANMSSVPGRKPDLQSPNKRMSSPAQHSLPSSSNHPNGHSSDHRMTTTNGGRGGRDARGVSMLMTVENIAEEIERENDMQYQHQHPTSHQSTSLYEHQYLHLKPERVHAQLTYEYVDSLELHVSRPVPPHERMPAVCVPKELPAFRRHYDNTVYDTTHPHPLAEAMHSTGAREHIETERGKGKGIGRPSGVTFNHFDTYENTPATHVVVIESEHEIMSNNNKKKKSKSKLLKCCSPLRLLCKWKKKKESSSTSTKEDNCIDCTNSNTGSGTGSGSHSDSVVGITTSSSSTNNDKIERKAIMKPQHEQVQVREQICQIYKDDKGTGSGKTKSHATNQITASSLPSSSTSFVDMLSHWMLSLCMQRSVRTSLCLAELSTIDNNHGSSTRLCEDNDHEVHLPPCRRVSNTTTTGNDNNNIDDKGQHKASAAATTTATTTTGPLLVPPSLTTRSVFGDNDDDHILPSWSSHPLQHHSDHNKLNDRRSSCPSGSIVSSSSLSSSSRPQSTSPSRPQSASRTTQIVPHTEMKADDVVNISDSHRRISGSGDRHEDQSTSSTEIRSMTAVLGDCDSRIHSAMESKLVVKQQQPTTSSSASNVDDDRRRHSGTKVPDLGLGLGLGDDSSHFTQDLSSCPSPRDQMAVSKVVDDSHPKMSMSMDVSNDVSQLRLPLKERPRHQSILVPLRQLEGTGTSMGSGRLSVSAMLANRTKDDLSPSHQVPVHVSPLLDSNDSPRSTTAGTTIASSAQKRRLRRAKSSPEALILPFSFSLGHDVHITPPKQVFLSSLSSTSHRIHSVETNNHNNINRTLFPTTGAGSGTGSGIDDFLPNRRVRSTGSHIPSRHQHQHQHSTHKTSPTTGSVVMTTSDPISFENENNENHKAH